MINWKAHPFLRLILPLIAGIVLGDFMRLKPSWYLFIIPFLFLPLFVRFVFFRMAFRQRAIYGLVVNLFFFILGLVLTTFYPEIHRSNHFSHYLGEDNYLVGIVSKPPTHKTRTNAILNIKKVKSNQITVPVSGHLYVSFPDSADIHYGQLIALHTTPKEFHPAANPYAFSFRAWQYYQNVHYQSFMKEGEWVVLAHNQGNYVLALAYRLRKKFQTVLRRILPDSRDLGVASALVLGVKDDLSPETKDAFSSTGAMHVLAVSGLHVGIVSVGLRYLMLTLLGRSKARRWWRLLAQLLGVWFFVLLTGAGASVMRAGVMFSIVEIGLAADRRASIFNSIAASAFLLLIWNPFLLYQVGFQLSYLALTGIVFFHPYIYKLVVFESSILNFLWNLGAVSIAAQISTFPLGIYYFHHFPLSFFLSGLVVVPMATILLPYTIFVFLVNFVSPAMADFLGVGLAFLFRLNNEFIFALSSIEWLKLKGLYFSKLTVWLSFSLVFSIGIWLASGRKRLIFLVLGFLTLLSLERNVLKYQTTHQAEICFFKLPKVDALGFIFGHQMYHYQMDSLAQKKWKYATEGLFNRKNIEKDIALTEKDGLINNQLVKVKNCWNFQGRIIEVVPPILPLSKDFHPNIIYVVQNLDSTDYTQLRADTIILGNMISLRNALAIENYFSPQGVFVYNIRQNGGLLVEN